MSKPGIKTFGYSGKSLVEKLGLKPNQKAYINNPPENINRLIPIDDFNFSKKLSRKFDLILFFTQSLKTLSEYFISFKNHLLQDGSLWVCWPKQSSKIPTDLNENIIRDLGLKLGMVDIKVCAVDEIWSGLKFVFRLKDRK
jgi:hypothetical protein